MSPLENEIERIMLAAVRAQLRAAEHNEAKAASERRTAELTEQKVIEALAAHAALAKRGRKS